MRLAIEGATEGLVDRDTLVELVVLSAIAGEHVLVIGPPGTAKSEAIRRIAHALGGKMFEYLVGRFTEPSELFGPVDLRKLKDGIVETATANMLPEAARIRFLFFFRKFVIKGVCKTATCKTREDEERAAQEKGSKRHDLP